MRSRSPWHSRHGVLDRNVLRNSLTLGFSVAFHHAAMLGMTPSNFGSFAAASSFVVPCSSTRSCRGVNVLTGSVKDAPKSLQNRRSLRLNQARTGPFLFQPAIAPSDKLIESF